MVNFYSIEIINNKARHNLMDGAVSFREPLGQTKVMQIRQGETLNYQGTALQFTKEGRTKVLQKDL